MAKDTGTVNIHGKDRNYVVTDDGRVFSVRELTPSLGVKNGYLSVTLGRGNRRYIHELVLETFSSKRPDGYQASHIDGDRTNNTIENLVWETPKANVERQVQHGTRLRGKQRHNSKLTVNLARAIVAEHERRYGENTRLAEKYGVHPNTVADLIKGRTWQWL